MKLSKILTTSVALGALMLTNVSSAAFITGTLEFFGTSSVTGTAANFNVDFGDMDGGTAGDQAMSLLGTDDLSGENGFANVFDFNSTGLPIAPLWSTTNFSFTLTSLTVDLFTFTGMGAVDNVTLSGSGVLSGAGYDDTKYNWDYSSQGKLTFSANTYAVPEPSIVALLGLGLVGMGVATRRKQKAS